LSGSETGKYTWIQVAGYLTDFNLSNASVLIIMIYFLLQAPTVHHILK